MKDSFKRSMKHFIQSHELNDKQFENLDALLKSSRKPRRSIWILSAAMSFALVSIVIGLLTSNGLFQKTEPSLLIAEEVAMNHLKLKPIEVSGGELSEISSYFSALDFTLAQSKYIQRNNLELIGGRYCSIQGVEAAQLRMKSDISDDVQVIYQAPFNQELFKDLPNLQKGQEPIRHHVNGITVDVWVENGILYARSFNQPSHL
ncbi:MAG: hypothetical protein AAGB35_05200 [Pseudomonadota bacterium]